MGRDFLGSWFTKMLGKALEENRLVSPNALPPKMEYFPTGKLVYFISDGSNVKIGATKNKLKKRFDSLQVGNARKLSLLAVHFTDQPFITEADYHRRYSAFRMQGEWFRINKYLITWIRTLRGLPWDEKKK